LFAVKGLHHPAGSVLATLRYVPDPEGDRVRDGVRYRRLYDLGETTRYLEERHPEYLSMVEELSLVLQTVPEEKIRRVYKPAEALARIIEDSVGEPMTTVARLVTALSEGSGVHTRSFGVSGSLLIGLQRPESDVDLNVYGDEEGRRVYHALRKLREESGWVKPYDESTVQAVLESRWSDTGIDLAKLAQVETAKVLHGLAAGRDYFIRLIRDQPRDDRSVPLGVAVVRGEVVEAEAIYTPCLYTLRGAKSAAPHGSDVVELLSFRGKFTEQAEVGDYMEARGTLEMVSRGGATRYRVILGGRGDYLAPAGLLDA
ncbi:hypothetical protein JXL21_02240, partial [Candidatus Bathyarchaeota archaeon]|nr:hypothetical protein [Candidatus Bathyarchaeota archaeon]